MPHSEDGADECPDVSHMDNSNTPAEINAVCDTGFVSRSNSGSPLGFKNCAYSGTPASIACWPESNACAIDCSAPHTDVATCVSATQNTITTAGGCHNLRQGDGLVCVADQNACVASPHTCGTGPARKRRDAPVADDHMENIDTTLTTPIRIFCGNGVTPVLYPQGSYQGGLDGVVIGEAQITGRRIPKANFGGYIIDGCGSSDVLFSVYEPIILLVGNDDAMTFGDLLSSGTWILDLHSHWNNVGWSFPVLLAICLVVIVAAFSLSPARILESVTDGRFYMYVGALTGFSAAAIEGIVHLGIAQFDADEFYDRLQGYATSDLLDSNFGEGLALVLVPNALAISVIVANLYVESKWVSSPLWAPFELLTAFSFIVFFYAGFYVGPSFWMAAALLRLYDLLSNDKSSLYR